MLCKGVGVELTSAGCYRKGSCNDKYLRVVLTRLLREHFGRTSASGVQSLQLALQCHIAKMKASISDLSKSRKMKCP